MFCSASVNTTSPLMFDSAARYCTGNHPAAHYDYQCVTQHNKVDATEECNMIGHIKSWHHLLCFSSTSCFCVPLVDPDFTGGWTVLADIQSHAECVYYDPIIAQHSPSILFFLDICAPLLVLGFPLLHSQHSLSLTAHCRKGECV